MTASARHRLVAAAPSGAVAHRAGRALALAAALTVAAAAVPSCRSDATLAIEYTLELDGAGTTPTEGGWRTTTDLGFEVEVLDGTISVYAATLVPCSSGSTAASAGARLRHALLPLALAGHAEDADPSTIEPVAALPLAPGGHALGAIVVPARCYSGAHWLVSGAVDATAETPLRDPSLELALDVRRDGALVQSVSFSTTVATGAIEAIDETSEGEIELAVIWPLARLFDGIAFGSTDGAGETLDDAAIARSILLSLAREAHAEAHGVVSVDPSRRPGGS